MKYALEICGERWRVAVHQRSLDPLPVLPPRLWFFVGGYLEFHARTHYPAQNGILFRFVENNPRSLEVEAEVNQCK